jgi:hypothetical protein
MANNGVDGSSKSGTYCHRRKIFDSAAREKSLGGRFRSGGTLSTRETAPPADAPIYVRRVRNALVLPETIHGVHMDNVVQLRDFKRREENEATLARFAKGILGDVDTSPCEMPPATWPSFTEKDPA